MSLMAQSVEASSSDSDGKVVRLYQPSTVYDRGIQRGSLGPRRGAGSASLRNSGARTSAETPSLNILRKSSESGTFGELFLSGVASTNMVFRKKLVSFGSTQIQKLSDLGSWAMVAVKGQGVLAESYSNARTPAMIQLQLPELLSSNASKV